MNTQLPIIDMSAPVIVFLATVVKFATLTIVGAVFLIFLLFVALGILGLKGDK